MSVAVPAAVDTDGDSQEHRAVEIDVYGRAGGLPRSWGKASAQLAPGAPMAAVDSLYSTGSDVDGKCIGGQAATPEKTSNSTSPNLPSAGRPVIPTNVYYAVSGELISF